MNTAFAAARSIHEIFATGTVTTASSAILSASLITCSCARRLSASTHLRPA